MKFGQAGLAILKLYEQGPHGGPALQAYKCPAGVWTIGYGHTKGVKQGDTCTPQQALDWLMEDATDATSAVNAHVSVPLNQNQFDALVCLVFNIGAFNFLGSTLRTVLNHGDYLNAGLQFPRWNKSNGQVLNGLVARRYDEKKLFETPV